MFKIFLIAFLLPIHSFAQTFSEPAKNFSKYTSTEPNDCATLNADSLYKEPEIDFYDGECPGFGGYQLLISGGDLRYAPALKFQDKELELVRLQTFHNTGSKAEWRFLRKKIKDSRDNDVYTAEPIALIYRLNFDDMDSNGNGIENTMLVVVRLQGSKSCVIGKIKKSSSMNKEAQKIADDLSASCL